MRQNGWVVLRLLVIAMAIVMAATPLLMAQTQQPVMVTKSTEVVSGNTVVTETTLVLVNGDLVPVKVEMTVISPGGQVLRKEETQFDPVTHQAIAKEVKIFQNGQVIEQKFRVDANGNLVIVKETEHGDEHGVEHENEQEHQDGGHH